MINPALFNNTLTLQSVTRTADGQGGWTEEWGDGGTFRARISPLSAQERLMQNKVTGATTHRIYCDNMNVSFDNRIKWGNYYFGITGIINPSEDYQHLEMDVREINYG